MPHLYVIDGTSALFRAHYGAPERRAPDGRAVAATIGLAQSIWRFLRTKNPRHVAVVFDSEGPCRRLGLDCRYKANRPPHPPELLAQYELAREAIRQLGVVNFAEPGVEADDLIATLTVRARRAGAQVSIVSPDKDVLTLRSPGVDVLDPKTLEVVTDAAIRQRFGVEPEQLFDYFCLVGDGSDNIAGLEGFGRSRARELLRRFPSIDAALAFVPDAKPKALDPLLRRLARATEDGPATLEHIRSLIRLYAGCRLSPEPRSFTDLLRRPPPPDAADFFDGLGEPFLRDHVRPLVAVR